MKSAVIESAAGRRDEPGTKSRRNPFLFPFLMVATLFFIWGFCHAMLDVLNKHFQNILHVSKTQSGFIQTAVFGAYFLMALPSALIIRRIGYQRGILLGLAVLAAGAFLFIPAGLVFKTFWAFLGALFVLSTGLACIETAANPYVTVLGPKDAAAGRLSTAQAFNSVAYIIAPTVGGAFIFAQKAEAGAPADFHSLVVSYVVLGFVVLLVFGIFSFVKLPDIDADGDGSAADDNTVHKAPLASQPHFLCGIGTQFLYIAAQVGVNAFAVNYILENAVTKDANGETTVAPLFAWYERITHAATPEAAAAYVITVAMVLYALGRFSAAPITRLVKPNLLLALYGIINTGIILLIMADIRQVSWMILPFCWFFMSIMFPFIFAMSLRNLGPKTKFAASFQIMSIVGGAVAAPLMGWLADEYHSMAVCFIIPLVGFIAPTIYGLAYPGLLEKSAKAV
jgi:FHS family L-fucose permease-like MFS transporter